MIAVFRETDGGAEFAEWETVHGDVRLSSYLLEKNWPFRRPQMASLLAPPCSLASLSYTPYAARSMLEIEGTSC